MRIAMHHHYDGFLLTLIVGSVGALLSALDLFPADLLTKLLTMAITGIVTGGLGELARRAIRNALKRAEARKFPLGLFEDPDKK